MAADHPSHPSAVEIVLRRMGEWDERPAVFWRGRELGYRAFLDLVDRWSERLARRGIGAGVVCGVYGDFSASSCALVFALMRSAAIAVPFTPASRPGMPELRALAGVQWMVTLADDEDARFEEENAADNALIAQFRSQRRPGLVVFTSGSSGTPKGILHDCERVVGKFLPERRGWRTLLFLLMDHFGGFNTFLSAFAYGGTAVCVEDRVPDAVCRIVEQARVALLPVTPTFLRLLVASGAWHKYDLSSVELITYGAEPMPPSTLDKIRRVFPRTRFKQTYGLSELGVLHSRSPEADSVWLEIGGPGFDTRVVDGVLWIRSASSMIGYLNAPPPFDGDGWMNTGDHVEVRDGLVRFLGRTSDVINVGGQKVFPSEVEDVLLEARNVRDATVYGIAHPLFGQVPAARITVDDEEPLAALRLRLRRHCAERLAKYKIPMRFVVAEGTAGAMNPRLKKQRDGS